MGGPIEEQEGDSPMPYEDVLPRRKCPSRSHLPGLALGG
jgi:hypothetical protein